MAPYSPVELSTYAILYRIWRNGLKDITVLRIGPKTVLIHLPCSQTREKVLKQGIWHIEGQTMFVAPYKHKKKIET